MYRFYRSSASGYVDALAILLLVAAIGTLLAVNFVRGQLRYSLYTSGAAMGTGLLAVLVHNAVFEGTLSWPSFYANAFYALRATFIFVGFFAIAAVLGAFYRHSKHAQAEENLDRLELLKRTLQLRERLAVPNSAAEKDLRYRSFIRAARQRWKLFAIGIGAALFLVRVIVGLTVGYPMQFPTTVQITAYLLTVALAMVAYPLVGFVAGSPRNGLFAGLMTYGTLYVGRLAFTPDQLAESAIASMDTFPWAGFAFPLLMAMAWAGGAGAKVQEEQDKRRLIEASDKPAVVAEIARLSGVLGMSRSEVICMVVDVVQSTKMKKEANPLAVEISFREYGVFVRREVSRHGGAVLSMAGDGIVAEFGSPASAFAAARQIQTLMPEFNRSTNTLKLPFRLRIGLHSGQVHGDLEQVSFAEVIDVAAHLEKKSPVGGIIVTEQVRDALLDETFIQIAESIDGHNVYIAQQPTID